MQDGPAGQPDHKRNRLLAGVRTDPLRPGIQSLPSAKTAFVASAEACVTTWVTARANRPAAAPTIAAAAAPLGDGTDRLVSCAMALLSLD